jgi:hypothetical protein
VRYSARAGGLETFHKIPRSWPEVFLKLLEASYDDYIGDARHGGGNPRAIVAHHFLYFVLSSHQVKSPTTSITAPSLITSDISLPLPLATPLFISDESKIFDNRIATLPSAILVTSKPRIFKRSIDWYHLKVSCLPPLQLVPAWFTEDNIVGFWNSTPSAAPCRLALHVLEYH